MKHLNFGIPAIQPSTRDAMTVAHSEPPSMDIGALEALFELSDALETIFNDFTSNGVSKESYSHMVSLSPAMESIDNSRMFSNTPSIRGLYTALESNVKERSGVIAKIIKFFADIYNNFVDWIKARFKDIKAWYDRIMKNRKKVNPKLFSFIPKIFKNKDAFVKATAATIKVEPTKGDSDKSSSLTPSTETDVTDATSKIIDEYQASVTESFKLVNENAYLKYTYFNFEGTEQFLAGFERYTLDFERIFDIFNNLNSAMETSDVNKAKDHLKSCRDAIDSRLPKKDWFKKREINVNEYSKKSIDLGDARFPDFSGKAVSMAEGNQVIKNSEAEIASFEKVRKILKDVYLDSVDGSFENLEAEQASECEALARLILNESIEIITAIQREYICVTQISIGLMVFINFIDVTAKKHTAKMTSDLSALAGASSPATSKFVQDASGVVATESYNDINDGLV